MPANTPLTAQRFANDLASFPLSKEELQEKLKLLEKYCLDWSLEYNTKKTKAIIFNKQGTLIKKFKFHHQNTYIDKVNQYHYLGSSVLPSQNMKVLIIQ